MLERSDHSIVLLDGQSPPPSGCEKFTSRLIWFLLFAQATGYTVFDIFFSIERSKNKKILDLIDPNTHVWWIAGLYFILTNAENYHLATLSCRDYCEIIRTRKLPNHWPKLSLKAYYGTLPISFLFTACVAYTECISFAYATQELGYSSSVGYSLGSLAGLATLTAWPQITELLFELAAWETKPYRNPASEWICKLMGYPWAFLSAAQIVTDSYFPMVDEFNLVALPEKWGIFFLSIISAISYLGTHSKMGITAMDDFIGKIAARQCPYLEEVFSFVVASSGSAILADLLRGRILSFLLSPEITLPFTLYNFIIDALAWSSSTYGGMISIHTAYPYLLTISRTLRDKLSTCAESFCQTWFPPPSSIRVVYVPPDIQIHSERIVDPPVKISEHRNALFTPTPKPPNSPTFESLTNDNDESEFKPRESCCTRLMKWFGCR